MENENKTIELYHRILHTQYIRIVIDIQIVQFYCFYCPYDIILLL